MRLGRLFPVMLIIAAVFAVSGCSGQKLYKTAINMSRNSADLSVQSVSISAGDIKYLDNFTENKKKRTQDTIIMLHGFGADKDNWLEFADELTDDFMLVIPDLPCHGKSFSDMNYMYSLKNQGEWIYEFMEALGIKKAHIIGSSMGGAISAELTFHHPEKVISLGLMNSAGPVKTESEFQKLLEKGQNPLIASSREDFKDMLDFVMEKKPYIPGPILKVLADKKIARKDKDDKVFKDFSKDLNNTSSILGSINVPSLIIWGDKDRVLHPDNANIFHEKLSDSRVVIMEDTGHLPMLERPEKTAAEYKKFILSL
ncbi:MAG: alpha/beta fold hydrolase [Thermodesulfobacteriota bacterium]